MATLGKKESGHHKEAAIVESFKQESMHGLFTEKSGHCREVAVVESWLFVEIRLYNRTSCSYILLVEVQNCMS